MPNIDPKVAFYFGLAIFIAGVIANAGAPLLEGAIPTAAIPIIIKWFGITNTIGTGVLTYMAGNNMTNQSRLANVKAVPFEDRAKSFAADGQVQAVITKDQAVADAVPSDKVIGPEQAKAA